VGDTVTITVFVVDDHRLFLSGVEAELSEHFEIAGTATDVDEAITAILEAAPDVVLVDVHIPGGGGVTVVRNVLERRPEARFLALSASDASDDVIAMIRAGARGYVTKSIAAGELVAAVRRVHDGDAVFSPRLAGFVLDAFAGTIEVPHDPELDQLTAREQEVLRLIARGHAYKQVARRMDISIKTVETHMTAVLRKLQLSNRHELARWASDRRIV
jgi:DNA-binding NarL/FixJ family response regulator